MATDKNQSDPERLFTKSDFCFSCIAHNNDMALHSYIVQNDALKCMLQESQLTLCSMCKALAHRTETFLRNLLLSRQYWQGNSLHTESVLSDIKRQMSPFENLTHGQGFDSEWSSSKITRDFELQSPKTSLDSDSDCKSLKFKAKPVKELLQDIKVEMKCEEKPSVGEGSLVAGQYQQTSNEFDIQKHMAAFTAAMQRSKQTNQERPVRRNVTKKTNYKIQNFRQSYDELMRERSKMAADRKYAASPLRCERCVKGFTFRSAFESHLMKHDESSGRYECDICHQRVDSEEKMQRHQKLHYERYRCPVCGMVRSCRSTIQEHLVAQHLDGQLLACPHCPKTFNRLVSRKKHIMYHHRGKPRVGCRFCPKTYMSKEMLKVHYATNHAAEVSEAPPRRPYPCPSCAQAFTAPSLLQKHMHKHSDKKEFYCVECDKSFKSESNLRTHLRVATPHVNYTELPFPCLHCEKKFSNRRDLEHHMNGIHLKIKPFQCDKCDRAYSGKCSLSKHIQVTHNGKRPLKHPCPVCDKVFDKHVLTNHIRTHTGERPYQCLQCDMKFSQASILSTHVKLVHLKLRRDGTKKEK